VRPFIHHLFILSQQIIQVFEHVLFAIEHSCKQSNNPSNDLFNHLQKSFKLPTQQQNKVLKTVKSRDAPHFQLNISQIEAKQLKPRYSKGSADTCVVLYLASDPTQIFSTSEKIDTLNPTWKEKITL
jgi:hypothetical protein